MLVTGPFDAHYIHYKQKDIHTYRTYFMITEPEREDPPSGGGTQCRLFFVDFVSVIAR